MRGRRGDEREQQHDEKPQEQSPREIEIVGKFETSDGTAVATLGANLFGAPPGVDPVIQEADGVKVMDAFMPYLKLVQDEIKVAVAQLVAKDEAQDQDILKLTSGASDSIGQHAAFGICTGRACDLGNQGAGRGGGIIGSHCSCSSWCCRMPMYLWQLPLQVQSRGCR